jgi:hypothetical protein
VLQSIERALTMQEAEESKVNLTQEEASNTR